VDQRAPEELGYDVVIAGGGPGGATLAAMLAKISSLKVGLFERDFFPREHIGESLIARLTMLLERTGALEKVMASDCWVSKPGGFFAWDPGEDPLYTRFFDHDAYDRDGVQRWAMHVNRSEFDQILFEHARDLGVTCVEGVGVAAVERRGEESIVAFDDGSQTCCRIFVDATGRQTSVLKKRRVFLSSYKNIAVWNHFVGGKPAQGLEGDWNIFRDVGAPIGNFVCDDGWFWYIPVRKMVMGQRTTTHSVGLVTDPKILSEHGKRYTDMEVFLAKARSVPLLGELLADAHPISDKVLTATNYSMISDELCNADEGWLLVGDVAFFVDPLFSSATTLAVAMGAQAACVIDGTLNSSLDATARQDLWDDYNLRFRTTANTLALMIDQWYHGIGRAHPDSIFAKLRGTWPTLDMREDTFPALLNLSVVDMMFDFGIPEDQGERWADLFAAPSQFFDPTASEDPPPDATIRLRKDVAIRPGALLASSPWPIHAPAAYWRDPVANGDRFLRDVSFFDCERFHAPGDPGARTVAFVDRFDQGGALFARLQAPPEPFGQLLETLTLAQRKLLQRLLRYDLAHAVS
jgi:2-polyprenyl-6-methoxyphenol hydroxylase-like FAD-dependent oxidoreductase